MGNNAPCHKHFPTLTDSEINIKITIVFPLGCAHFHRARVCLCEGRGVRILMLIVFNFISKIMPSGLRPEAIAKPGRLVQKEFARLRRRHHFLSGCFKNARRITQTKWQRWWVMLNSKTSTSQGGVLQFPLARIRRELKSCPQDLMWVHVHIDQQMCILLLSSTAAGTSLHPEVY